MRKGILLLWDVGSNVYSEEANLNYCFSCYHCFLLPLFLLFSLANHPLPEEQQSCIVEEGEELFSKKKSLFKNVKLKRKICLHCQ